MFNITRKQKNIDDIQNILNGYGEYSQLRTKAKNPIRNLLLDDQWSICCYCERSLPSSNREVIIEHFSDDLLYDLKAENINGACKTCNEEKYSTRAAFRPFALTPTHPFNPSVKKVESLFSCVWGAIHTPYPDFKIFIDWIKLTDPKYFLEREEYIKAARSDLYWDLKSVLNKEKKIISKEIIRVFSGRKHPYNGFIRKNMHHVMKSVSEELINDGFVQKDVKLLIAVFLQKTLFHRQI